MALHQIPAAKQNNEWYSYSDADTVLIFLHGIFSDSRGCWLYEEPRARDKSAARSVYWPELVRKDPVFAGADIFLAGFYTDIEAQDYDLVQCATKVYDMLNAVREPAKHCVMAKKNLVFIGHSTGGIVARYVLERNQIAFREKNIGVVLIASPSEGSIYATWFDFLSKIYQNELGGLLTEENTILKELDGRFREMVYKKNEHIPNLIGREACENHMVLRRKIFGRFSRFVPPTRRLVEPTSACRYFGQGRMLADTDHFSTVKPDSPRHPAHEFLQSFWSEYREEFLKPSSAAAATVKAAAQPVILPPKLPDRILGRDAVIADLKKRLQGGGSHALCGPVSTGKHGIVLELAYDAELREAYPDGILWGDLRADGSTAAVLASWAEALGVPRNTVLELKRPQDRAVAVAQAIGNRRMLLLADHCDRADALLFQLAGPNCAHLLVTHSQDIAKDFAGDSIVHVEYLTDEEALQIMEQFAPALASHRSATLPFVRSLGGIPARVMMFARMLGSAPAEALQTLQILKNAAKETV